MIREEVVGDSIFVIRDFLTPVECEGFIADSEARGYEAAAISTTFGALVRPEVRNNNRVIFEDRELAAEWFARVLPALPEAIGDWRPVGLNERFRFYRYDPGQTFRRHYDAPYSRRNGEESVQTLMVYLNEGYEGGETAFFHPDDRPKAVIQPVQGMALVFYHQQVHEGATVVASRKYVLRTDVMYKRSVRR